MSKDFTFPFFYKEWLVSTQGMDADVRGWYINLLAHQADKGALPNDIESLAELAGVKFSKYNRFKECFKHTLASKFPKNEDGNLVNARMKIIKDGRDIYKEKQRNRGIVGAFVKNKRKKYQLKKSQWDKISSELMTIDFSKNKKELDSALSIRFKHTLEAFIDNEDDNDIKNRNENRNDTSSEKPAVILPWDTENFRTQWQLWKGYKKKHFNFEYKTLQSEQAALTQLSNLAEGNEKTAIAIIHQSFAQGWKGFFELKENKTNGNRNSADKSTDADLRRAASDAVDRLLG